MDEEVPVGVIHAHRGGLLSPSDRGPIKDNFRRVAGIGGQGVRNFDAVVTGASDKGTWVRLLSLHVEGRLVEGFQGLDVGAPVRAQLVKVDVERGFIDLKAVPPVGTR